MKTRNLLLACQLFLATAVLALFASCGGGGGGGSYTVARSPGDCPQNGMPKLPMSCCEGGHRVRFDGDCAGPELAPVPAINGSLSQAAAAGAVAAASNKAAAALTCEAAPSRDANPVLTEADTRMQKCAAIAAGGSVKAATAGGSGEPSAIAFSNIDPKLELDSGPKLPKIPGTATGAGGLAGSPLNSMTGSLTSDGTAPSPPLGPEPHLVIGSPEAIAAAGRGAGAAQGQDPGVGGGGLSWASLGASAKPTGAESGALNFGASSGGVNPMGSEDPEHYFTLLNLGDSIFKAVERRYRSKSMDWASRDFAPQRK